MKQFAALITILTLLSHLIGCTTTEENKHKADLYVRLGAANLDSGKYALALKHFLQAESLDSENPVIQNNLGLTYFLRERFDLALVHFQKAVKVSPQFTDARNNLARTLVETGRYEEALQHLEIVQKDLTYPELDKAYINQGLLYFNQKKWPEAEESFRKAVKERTDSCYAQNYLGRTLFEQHNYSVAVDVLDKAIGFCQKMSFDEPHYYSALSMYRMGDKNKAMTRFQEIIKLYPTGAYQEKSRAMLDLLKKGL
jgi:Tfp pilus assembly protein PilF